MQLENVVKCCPFNICVIVISLDYVSPNALARVRVVLPIQMRIVSRRSLGLGAGELVALVTMNANTQQLDL